MSLKKFTTRFVILSITLISSIAFFIPQKATAQLAVPVMEMAGSPLLVTTVAMADTLVLQNIIESSTSFNTAMIAAKETGTGLYTPPSGPSIPIAGPEIAFTGAGTADSIGVQTVKLVMRQFTNSIVAWINSGFEGGPSFVTDPETFFLGVADRVAGNFIAGTELGFLCEPFKLDIRFALNINYNRQFRDEIGCTLTDVVANIDNFQKDFTQGGWGGWFSMTQNPSNNRDGAFLSADSEMRIRIATAKGTQTRELDWADGFLSFKKCEQKNEETGECEKYGPARTPGRVIEDQLSESLSSDLRQWELADEFDEIIGALLNQMMKQVMSSSGGLFGS